MLLIESRDERFVNEVGEQNSLWYRVSVQRRRLRCRKSASFNGFLRRRGRLCFYDISLREFSGFSGSPLLEPIAECADPGTRLMIDQALRRLPAEQREVLYLKVYEGMTFQEIAVAIGEPLNTVASRYRYALEKLRTQLGASR